MLLMRGVHRSRAESCYCILSEDKAHTFVCCLLWSGMVQRCLVLSGVVQHSLLRPHHLALTLFSFSRCGRFVSADQSKIANTGGRPPFTWGIN